MAKLDPQRLIFGLFLLVLILVAEVIFIHFKLPGWPAFMVMIFFFVEHMNKDKAPQILAGGLFGLVCLILLVAFRDALGPILGKEIATLLFVAIFVYAIVAFGEMVPIIFNNYAFMIFTVAAGVATAAKDAGISAGVAVGTATAKAAGVAAGAANGAAVAEAAGAAVKTAVPDAVKVAVETAAPVFVWMGVELIGGAIFIAGILGILKIVTIMATRKAMAAAAAAKGTGE